MHRSERRFRRDIAVIPEIHEFVSQFLAARGVGPGGLHGAALVTEELFTNQVRHAEGGLGDITISLDVEGGELVLRLVDFGVAPWDLTQSPEFRTAAPIGERRAGGMGIHLVRCLARALEYDHRDGNSHITVRLSLES